MAYTQEERKARSEARKVARKVAKHTAEIEAERNGRRVERIQIAVEWHRSRTWGNCPKATASVYYAGEYDPVARLPMREQFTATASGCGYDKASSVVADLLNKCLKYTLWAHPLSAYQGNVSRNCRNGETPRKAPYGVRGYEVDGLEGRYFEGGVGMSCYTAGDMAKWIGGSIRHTASGEHFDAYEYVAGQFAE